MAARAPVSGFDLRGRRFGELTALARGPGLPRRGGGAEAQWLCACTCGEERMVRAGRLLSGTTTTCGREHRAERIAPAYAAVHDRLRAAYGPAAAQRCVECGGPAAQWSLDVQHDHPDLLASPGGYLYSVDLDLYVPRCRRCHGLVDELERRRRNRPAVLAGKPVPDPFPRLTAADRQHSRVVGGPLVSRHDGPLPARTAARRAAGPTTRRPTPRPLVATLF